ncbi:hypothetical protein ABPG74_018169 [Tetrahymena malaccensis]
MKSYRSIYILFIISFFTQVKLQQQQTIDNCVDYIQVSGIYDLSFISQTLCIECQKGYIVSKNFRQCIDIRHSQSNQQFIYCKRMTYSGFCAEAIENMVIFSNQTFSQLGDFKLLERCAIVSYNKQGCIYPRFGYILDIKKGLITKDIFRTFCALYDSEIEDCVEFQSGFIRLNNTQLGTYLEQSIINPDQILPISNSERIFCSKGFEYRQTRFLKGCVLKQIKSQQINIQIHQCQQMMNDIQCKLCQNGYALRDDKQKCQIVIKNCQEYTQIQNQIFCTKCLPFYSLLQQSCIFIKGCQVISRKNPSKCIACSEQFELIDGKCVNQKSSYSFHFQNGNVLSDFMQYYQVDSQKNEKAQEIYFDINEIKQNIQIGDCSALRLNECLKCSNLSFYFDQKQKKCIKRIRSLYCINKIYNQDDCLNLECQENYWINKEIFEQLDLQDQLTLQYIKEYLSGRFFDSDYVMNDLEIQEFYQRYQKKGASLQKKIYCLEKQATYVQNCIQFDTQNNQCQQCQQGYYLINHTEFDDFSFKSQCLSNLDIINLDYCVFYDIERNICYECQEGYYFNSKFMKCLEKIRNCYIHTLENECLLCEEGHFLNQEICLSFSAIEQQNLPINQNYFNQFQQNPYCVLFQNYSCIQCAEGFLIDKASNFQCQLDSLFPDCKTVDLISQDQYEISITSVYTRDYKVCQECREGYFIVKGFCIKQSKLSFQNNILDHQNKITNCLMYDDDSNICLQCDYDYYFSQKNNQCIRKIKFDRLLFEQQLEPVQDGCQLQDEGGRCKMCKNNLFLMINFNCYEECPQDYIVQYDSNHGIVCYDCPLNCQKCQFDYDYAMLFNQAKCLSCFVGQILNSETYQCMSNCEFLIEEDTNLCVKKCNYNYFQSDKKCLKSCLFFYTVHEKEKVCIADCQGMFRYEDDPKKCSKECDEGYASLIDQKICKKCMINSCKTCNVNELNICMECQKSYTNVQGKCKYQCLNKLIVDDKNKCDNNLNIEYCIKQLYEICQECQTTFELTSDYTCQCPEGTYFDQETNQCEQCGFSCLQCDQKLGCLKCAEPYYRIQFFDKFKCTDKCGPGYFVDQIQNVCLRCQKNCLKCQNTNKCDECFPTFQFYNIQNKMQCLCPPSYVINEESNICELQCKDGFKPDTMKCCEIQHCSQCNKSHQICDQCNENFPYLFQNSCRKECPEGYYQDNTLQNCKKCSPLCSKCIKDQSNCLSCSLPQGKIEDSSCKCKKNKVFFQNDCFFECPKYTVLSPDGMVCEEYCTDFSYPVFDELGRFERCEFDLGQPDSKFCYQNLSSLNRLVDFSISEEKGQQNSQSFLLVISISKTPKDCYIFKLRGKDDNDSFHIIQRLKDQKNQDLFNLNFYLESKIEINYIQENNLVECNDYYCIFYFEVYLKNTLQQIFKLRVSLEFNSVSVEGVQDFSILLNGEQNAVSPQSIPQEQLLQSVLQVQCDSSNYCNQKQIKTEINHPILMNIDATFKFGSDEDNLLTIYPLSLYILENNSLKLPIDTFYFDNSFTSSIKLTVYFQHEAKGQLIIILRAFNQKYFMKGLEFFSYENNYLKFLVQKVDLEVLEAKKNKDKKEDEEQQKKKNAQSEQQGLINIIIYCFKKMINKRNQPQQTEQVDILNITEEKSTQQPQQVQIELS